MDENSALIKKLAVVVSSKDQPAETQAQSQQVLSAFTLDTNLDTLTPLDSCREENIKLSEEVTTGATTIAKVVADKAATDKLLGVANDQVTELNKSNADSAKLIKEEQASKKIYKNIALGETALILIKILVMVL